ncbi:MAG: hypothetical protein LBV39_05140 [Bacteroidales bacterium]|jgi:hypothetical protein|nr:hypothetical protein [Bacteroidales bacterium]
MIKEQILYERFVETLRRKVSGKSSLVNLLTDILLIEKDAVYRRIRGEVSFTFAEIASIAEQLGISLDNLIGVTCSTHRPSHLKVNKHGNPTEADYKTISDLNNKIKGFKGNPDAELAVAGNILPQNFYLDFDFLTRYYLFVWELTINENGLNFAEVAIPERTKTVQKNLISNMRSLTASFVLDFMLFQYLVTDIKYFASIHRIEPEDVLQIKNDLFGLLNFIETVCNNGKFDEGGTAHIFVSDVNISTNYMYIKCEDFLLSMVKAFILDGAVSYDQLVFKQTQICVASLKQVSTLISGSGGRSRTLFFDKQRKIIDSL